MPINTPEEAAEVLFKHLQTQMTGLAKSDENKYNNKHYAFSTMEFSPNFQMQLANHPDPEINAAIAKNPHADPKVHMAMLDKFKPGDNRLNLIVRGLGSNGKLNPYVAKKARYLIHLSQDNSSGLQRQDFDQTLEALHRNAAAFQQTPSGRGSSRAEQEASAWTSKPGDLNYQPRPNGGPSNLDAQRQAYQEGKKYPSIGYGPGSRDHVPQNPDKPYPKF
jgi:hypothetical protein